MALKPQHAVWAAVLIVPAAAAGYFGLSAPKRADGICLMAPLRFADGAVSGCLKPQEAQRLMSRPVALGEGMSRNGVTLTNPTKDSEQRVVATCDAYGNATRAGWYALSSADMAAEGFMKRNCGAIEALARGHVARSSFLGKVKLSDAGASIGELGPGVAADTTFEEIARADFNGDGVEDILAFASIRAEGGTMRADETIVLSRNDVNAPLRRVE